MAADGDRISKRDTASDVGRPDFDSPRKRPFDWQLFLAISGALAGTCTILATVFIFMINNVYRAVDDLDQDMDTLSELVFVLSSDVAAIKNELTDAGGQPDRAAGFPDSALNDPVQASATGPFLNRDGFL